MHTVFALLCFVVVIHWLIFPYPWGLLHWHCGNLTIAPVPAMQPWWIWINTSCEFIMNDCVTTTKQGTTKPCVYFLGYTVLFPVFPHGDSINSLHCRFISLNLSKVPEERLCIDVAYSFLIALIMSLLELLLLSCMYVGEPTDSGVDCAEFSLIIGVGYWVQVFSLILGSSVSLLVGVQSAGDSVPETLVRILHSVKQGTLSPFN